MKNHTKCKLVHCPSCKHRLNEFCESKGLDHPPQVGDLAVCFFCGTLSEFTKVSPVQLKLVDTNTLTDEERNAYQEVKKTLVTSDCGGLLN
jgi:hypothetical protein